jgi:hypothetical protein
VPIANEAFIDIEMALHEKVEALWMKHWRELEKKLNKLANQGKWLEAEREAQNLDFGPIVEEAEQLARTLAEAALFLGASRLGEPEDASFFGAPDEVLIDTAVAQWATVIRKNATIALRLQVQVILGEMEITRRERDDQIIKGPRSPLAPVGTQGAQFSGIAASLMISRASTAGFFAEAQARGVKVYRVSEVMDSATCPVCRTMHNQEFPIAAGVAMSTSIMQATDPDSLRQIAPFPSQSAANVQKIQRMNQGALVSAGLNLPPYHPWCRGIATIVTSSASTASVPLSALVGLTGRGSVGDAVVGIENLDSDTLTRRLFGDVSDLEQEQLGILLTDTILEVEVVEGPAGGLLEGILTDVATEGE